MGKNDMTRGPAIQVTITVTAIIAGTAIVITLGYFAVAYFTSTEMDWKDSFKFSVSVIVAAIAAYGAMYAREVRLKTAAGQQVQVTHQNRLVTAIEELLNSLRAVVATSASLQNSFVLRGRLAEASWILRFLDEGERVDQRIKIRDTFGPIRGEEAQIRDVLSKDKSLNVAIAKVLGSFEDMALAIRLGLADEELLYYSMNLPLTRLVDTLDGYINLLRRGYDTSAPNAPFDAARPHVDTIFIEVTELAAAWKKKRSIVTNSPFPELRRTDRFPVGR